MKAKITICSVEVTCPSCNEPLPHPDTGAHLWPTNEQRWAEPFKQTCACGVVVTVTLTKSLRRQSY